MKEQQATLLSSYLEGHELQESLDDIDWDFMDESPLKKQDKTNSSLYYNIGDTHWIQSAETSEQVEERWKKFVKENGHLFEE